MLNNSICIQNEFLTKKIYLVVSFFVTKEEALSKLKMQWSKRTVDHSKVLGRSLKDVSKTDPREMGGSIAVVDPANFERGFLKEIEVPLAFGMCFDDINGSLVVAGGNVLNKVKHGVIQQRHTNKIYNDIHGLSRSESGIIVSSTGTDALIEVQFDNLDKVSWEWLATENGYNLTGDGKVRKIDRNLDYGDIITSTPEHTTHLNGSFVLSLDKVLVTLFHQGYLIEIDKNTKRSKVVLSGLRSPHNLRSRRGGYSLCDTRENQVLLLDEKFNIQKRISAPNFNWIQDAIEVTSLDGYLIADSNNGRILLVNHDGEELTRLQYDANSRKVASLELLTGEKINKVFSQIPLTQDTRK